MLTERTEQAIRKTRNGMLEVQDITIIERDGVFVSETYHRHVVDVDDDTANESAELKAMATVLWTQEVKSARISEKARAR